MATRETLAAADLIPGDILPVRGWHVTGYPYAGVLDRTALPVTTAGGLNMIAYVPSETPYSVIR
jgi:hypothetical protein